jgi:hypothetical protein
MGQTIDVINCFKVAVEKMFDGIRQRYQFKVEEDAGDAIQRPGKITVGYSIVDK